MNRKFFEMKQKYENKIDDLDSELRQKDKDHETEINKLKLELKRKNLRIAELEKELGREKIRKKQLANEKSEVACQLREKIVEVKTYEKVGTSKTQINYIHPKLAGIPIDNIRPLTIETVQDAITDGGYTYDMFQQGETGLVNFITGVITLETEPGPTGSSGSSGRPGLSEPVVERNYACTDGSRNKFHRLLESKKWTKDDGAMFLGNILDELKEPAKKYYLQMIETVRSVSGDPLMRDVYNTMLDAVKPIYFGISSTGSHRTKLFENLRAKIRIKASV